MFQLTIKKELQKTDISFNSYNIYISKTQKKMFKKIALVAFIASTVLSQETVNSYLIIDGRWL